MVVFPRSGFIVLSEQPLCVRQCGGPPWLRDKRPLEVTTGETRVLSCSQRVPVTGGLHFYCLNSIYVSPVSEFCVFLPVRQDMLSAMCLEWKGSAVSLLVGVENDP